jgi:hypothetical protein
MQCTNCVSFQNRSDAHAANMLVKLEGSFKWELRTLYLGPLVVAAFLLFSKEAATIVGVLLVFPLIVMDGAFSIVVTMIFVRPLYRLLRMGSMAADQSQGYYDIQKTMCMTLFGSSLAVFSSTALYINVVLHFYQQDTNVTNHWQLPLVFGPNADSILNDVGMLFVCGVLKNIKWTHLRCCIPFLCPQKKATARKRNIYALKSRARKKSKHVFVFQSDRIKSDKMERTNGNGNGKP